jgi:glutamate formiminotransferase/formiminotetrahydrofolate cyclodeaminase
MTRQLIECIPNFSEGRRGEVVDAIVDAIAAFEGIHILDRQSDTDHNRSVITFVGTPENIVEAAFAGIAKAAEHIDLDTHQGAHPRIGATDVVPFVPLSGVKIEECIELAKTLGTRVGGELGIPVYLYEAAATRPDRTNLADIRKGEYESLKESIISDPNRVPDYGPAKLGKAGATVIGARAPLIAYNVYLNTDDVNIAKKVAAAMRHSSGGFAYVKALGLLVDGRAQVSMNLTDYTRTPVARVVEAIRREAVRYGTSIHHTELVGLIPQAAVFDAAQWYLQLDGFQSDQVLETKLYNLMSASEPTKPSFLDQLAAGTATPGGGSAAAYSGAMAAALAAMVARLTMGKKKYAEVEARMNEIAAKADELKASLEEAVKLDSQAFEQVMAAYRLPKDTEEQNVARTAAVESAMHRAAEVPLEVVRQVVEVLELLAEVAEQGNANAVTDAASGTAMARAALTAAGMNVKVNAKSISDPNVAKHWLENLKELESQALQADDRIRAALMERVGLE